MSDKGKGRGSGAKRASKRTSGDASTVPTTTEQPTTSAEGSGSGSKKSSGYDYGSGYDYSGYGSTPVTSTPQSLQLEEIKRPPVYKRIACIRYVRPMMTYDDCWGGSQCGPGPGYPYCYDPYFCGYPGECFNSTRAFIVPPRSKSLYRPAREEDFNVGLKTVDECPSFLKIRGECDRGEGPKTPPKPPPPPKPKPKVDTTKLLKKYLHESKPKRKKKKTPPPKEKKRSPPPKKKKPPPPKEKSPPPKEKTPPPKEKSPPPKVEKKPSPPKPPPPPPPKVEKKPSPPPPPPSPHEDSSKSSANSAHDEFKTTGDGRELHHQTDVVRRTSSFEAITHAAIEIKNTTSIEAVAPQRRR